MAELRIARQALSTVSCSHHHHPGADESGGIPVESSRLARFSLAAPVGCLCQSSMRLVDLRCLVAARTIRATANSLVVACPFPSAAVVVAAKDAASRSVSIAGYVASRRPLSRAALLRG